MALWMLSFSPRQRGVYVFVPQGNKVVLFLEWVPESAMQPPGTAQSSAAAIEVEDRRKRGMPNALLHLSQ